VGVDQPLPNISYFLSLATTHGTWLHQVVDIRGEEPVVGYARLLVGPEPALWRDNETWRYRDYVFTARNLRLRDVRDWFESCDPSGWPTLIGEAGELRPRRDTDKNLVTSTSHPAHDALHYPFPTVKFPLTLDVPDVVRNTPADYFVGDGSPSFASAAGAFNAFLYNDFRASGVSPPSMGVMEVLFADTRGGFERVVVRPSSIEVTVSGDGKGLRVELGGATDRVDVPLPDGRTLELPLSNGLPREAWLWLKSGTEWLDRRSFEGNREGITFELPEDPVADLSAVIAQGEDDQLEFKSQLPDAGKRDSKRKTFKTVAAFAQDAGGIVIFGVEDDSGVVEGIPEDEETAKQRFTSMLNSSVRPTPKFRLSYQELDGKSLLVALIQASGQIHSVVVDPDRPEYYVRRGATTFHARAEDLERVFSARPTGGAGPAWA
jgi:hypothetical protein